MVGNFPGNRRSALFEAHWRVKQFFSVTRLIPLEFKQEQEMNRGETWYLCRLRSRDYSWLSFATLQRWYERLPRRGRLLGMTKGLVDLWRQFVIYDMIGEARSSIGHVLFLLVTFGIRFMLRQALEIPRRYRMRWTY